MSVIFSISTIRTEIIIYDQKNMYYLINYYSNY